MIISTWKIQSKSSTNFRLGKFNRHFIQIAFNMLIVLMLGNLYSQGQTNPTTGSLPFTFNGASTVPGNMAIHRFGTSAAAIPTSRITTDANGDLPVAGTGTSGGYVLEGASGANGISMLASSSQSAGAIVAEFATTGLQNITVSWVAWTVLDQASYTVSMALQYRAADNGAWINVDDPASSVYTTSTTGRANGVSFSQNLPAGANNKSIVQVRWLYWISAGSAGSRDRLGVDDINISGSALTTAPTVTTTSATSITNNSASSGGNVTSDGGASISARGVAFGTSANPTTGTSESGTTGTFTSSLSPLSPNTQYFYRAYATNSQGTSYGSESSFYTLANVPGAPTVNNPTVSSLDVTVAANSNPSTTQFAIQEAVSGNYVQTDGTLGGTAAWQTASAWGTKTVTGLSVNTSYSFQVKARNTSPGTETSFGSPASLFTVANTPGTPTVNNATATTLDVTVSVNSNPVTTQFAIQETGSGNYVQTDGTLGAFAAWQTASAWGTIAVNGLAASTSYTFQVKARNGNNVETGFGSTASETTLASGTPSLSANTLTAFGSICLNVTTSANTFTITGVDLSSADVTVASLSGFTFSTDDITYTASLNIPQGGGAFSQLIYVKFTPTAVLPYNGNIVVGGGGASSINIAASGSGINTAATVTAGAATGITISAATIPGTITGNGCSSITAYGVEYSSTPGFPNGTGTPAPGSNLSGNNFSVSLSGLNSGTPYYYHTYATNNGGTSYSAEGSFTTLTPVLSVDALTGFGNVCTGTTAGPNSFTITGTNLSAADVTVAALTGFTFSTDNITYTASLSIPQAGGSFSQLIYVKFSPTLEQSYNNNIVIGGAGAANVNRSVTGSGINTPVTVNTTAAGSITQFAAILNGSYTAACSAVTAYGFEYSLTNGFNNGDGTNVPSGNQSAGVYSAGISGLEANTTYYYKVWATDNSGKNYGSQQSFTTAQLDAPNATAATSITSSSFQANWIGVTGATGYRLDVSKFSNFSSTLATDLFFSEYVEGAGNTKYIEIYNGTGATVDLSDYRLRLYSNGSATPSNDVLLTGTVATGSTVLYRNASATNITGSISNAAVNFTGNDAVALYKVSTSSNVDIFGSIGFDPGASGWTGAGGYQTADKTLRRKSTVSAGLTSNPANSFPTLTTEWNLFNVGTISDLGSHTYTASNPSFLAGYNNLAVAGTSKSVTGLTAGTTYYYRVRATSTNSTSANSGTITAVTCVDLSVSVSIAAAPGNTVCAGTFVTFTATPTNGGSTPTYQWYNGASPISGETADTYTTNSLVNGDQVSVVLTSSESCTTGNPATSNTVTMTINPLPSVSFSGLSASYCVTGVPATLVGSPAGGTFSGTGISGNTFDPATAGVGGPYTITYTYTNENGCTNTATQNVSVTAAENVDWANLQWPPTGTICEGGSHTAYGQVYESGVTEAGGQGAGILVEIGYSSSNTNPNTWTNWQTATFNTQIGNNDEYMGTFGDNLAAGTYYYTFRYSRNGCGYQYGGYSSGGGNFWNGTTFVSGVLTVNPALTPSVSIAANTGTTICAGSSVTFTATPTNGGTSPAYQWYNGASPIGGETANTYTTSSITDGDQISVLMTSNATPCLVGGPATSNTLTMTVNPNLPVSVSIAAAPGHTVCAGTSVTFTATPTNGGTTPVYQWYNGASPISGETAGTYITSSLVNNDQVSVIMTSNETCTSGNPATSNTITMTVNPSQPVSVSIAANPGNTICAGTPVTFTATPTNGGSSPTYQWYNGASPISGETGATYTSSTLVNGDAISVVLTSDITPCATGNPATSNTITMTVNQPVAVPGDISGPLDVCPHVGTNVAITYSVDAVPGAASYQWTVPTGATIQSGQGTTSIDVLIDNSFAQTNQQFRVRSVSAEGCISAPSSLIVLKNIPAIPAVINGPVNVCPFTGQSFTATYSTTPVQYATSYNWVVTTGATIVSGQGTTSIEVSFLNTFTVGNVRVTALSNCGSRAAKSITISKLLPSGPGAITGPVNACPYVGTNTPVQYSIAPTANAVSYQWTVPSNVTLVSGQGTTSITVTFGTGYVTSLFKVKAVAACAVSGERTLSVTSTSYAAPGAITGPTNACPYIGNATQATYTIRKVANAPAYNWTVPTGVTIVSHPGGTGVNDTIINVTYDNSFVANSSIAVQTTGCFTSSATTLQVTRVASSGTPGLIAGPKNVCEYMVSAAYPSGLPATYTVRKISNATSYLWTAPAGAAITAHPGGTGVNDTIVEITFSAGFVSGNVSVASSNACGFSAPRTQAVTKLNPASPGGLDVIMLSACPSRQYSYTMAAMPANATAIQWTAPAGATIVSGQGTTSLIVSYPSTAISGAITATPYNNCGTASTRSLTIKLPACPPSFTKGIDYSTGKGNAPTVAETMNVNVYPNPTTTDFKLQVLTAAKEEIRVQVSDMAGRVVKQVTVMPYQTINIGSELKAGSYMIAVRQGGSVKTTRVIKF